MRESSERARCAHRGAGRDSKIPRARSRCCLAARLRLALRCTCPMTSRVRPSSKGIARCWWKLMASSSARTAPSVSPLAASSSARQRAAVASVHARALV